MMGDYNDPICMDNGEHRRLLCDELPAHCRYRKKCAGAINLRIAPWHFCQCYHGRKETDADFAHEAMMQL